MADPPDRIERSRFDPREVRIERSPAALARNGLVVLAWTALLAWLFARRSYPETAFYALAVGALVFYLILLASVDSRVSDADGGAERSERNRKG
ncbi:hypothetical protein [Natronorarus salvus]|uniref:hypothetical protein n=1 Tax=Natronorarus salvus TaxID=3117733 RepID=UPI002F25F2EA